MLNDLSDLWLKVSLLFADRIWLDLVEYIFIILTSRERPFDYDVNRSDFY